MDILPTELPGPISFEETDSRGKLFSKELTEWTVIVVKLFLDIFSGINVSVRDPGLGLHGRFHAC